MKVLILGSEGMLGTALMSVFDGAWTSDGAMGGEFEVSGFDKNELDITDRGAVLETLHEREPDLVINAAGYTDVDGAEISPEKAAAVNKEACGYVAEACYEISAPLVHFSTDYVFDGKNPAGYDEMAEPNPINAYGRSKLAGEKIILENLKQFFLIRTSWLFGPNGKNFVDTMLKLGRENSEVSVVNDQIGNPTYTLDLANAVYKLVTQDFDYGIYHITNDDSVTWYDFAREIFKEAGIKVETKPVSSKKFKRPAKRPACSILLNEKFPRLRLRPHKDALAEYLKTRV